MAKGLLENGNQLILIKIKEDYGRRKNPYLPPKDPAATQLMLQVMLSPPTKHLRVE